MADLTPEQMHVIDEALEQGRKIQAIKLYRDATGQGLKETKAYIDNLVPRLIERDPVKYAKLKSGSGCVAMIVLALLVLGGILVMVVWLRPV